MPLVCLFCAMSLSECLYRHNKAFAFHRTAFKERLDTISEALKVVVTLRLYRPKHRSHANKPSRSAPLFSAFGLLPTSQERTADSRSSTPRHSRVGTLDGFGEGETSPGHEADVEDADATLVRRSYKGKQRTSWLENQKRVTEPESMSRADQHVTPESPHRYPPSPPKGRSFSDSSSDDDAAALVHQAAHQAAKVIKTAVLHDARGIRGEIDDDLGGLVWNVTSAHEAKRLARSIYLTFKDRHRNYLLPSDFYPVFPTEEAAQAAFRVFDKDNNGDLSRAEIKTTLMKIYRERRFLSRSMRDVSVALKTLDNMILLFALVILFFISLSVFGVNIDNALTSIYTIGIGASFIFRNAASNAFDAVMFIFVTQCV